MKVVSTQIYMTESQTIQHHWLCQMCENYLSNVWKLHWIGRTQN